MKWKKTSGGITLKSLDNFFKRSIALHQRRKKRVIASQALVTVLVLKEGLTKGRYYLIFRKMIRTMKTMIAYTKLQRANSIKLLKWQKTYQQKGNNYTRDIRCCLKTNKETRYLLIRTIFLKLINNIKWKVLKIKKNKGKHFWWNLGISFKLKLIQNWLKWKVIL